VIRFLRNVLTCATVALMVPAAFAGVLDPTFADEGVKVLDFAGEPGMSGSERGIANCPAAGDRQLVVLREAGGLIVARLSSDGSLDASFGDGGVRHHAVATNTYDTADAAAICRADGGIWIVANFTPSAEYQRIRLIALGPDGALAPGGAFGSAGYADVEFDVPELLPNRGALGFHQSPDGRAFATGYVDSSENESLPWMIALNSQGVLHGVRVFRPDGVSGLIEARAAGVGPGGGIWVVGHGWQANRVAFRSYLDPKSLALVRTETFAIPGEDIDVAGGTMVRSGVMAVGAARRLRGAHARPILLVMRTDSEITMLDLPLPGPLEDGGQTGISADGQAISSLPGGRVLYGVGAEAWSGPTFKGYKGWYFSRAVIGASSAEDHVDADFGDGGSAVLSLRSGESDCDGLLNTQKHSRAGVWQGRPTVIGWWKRHCAPEGENDGILMRLRPGDGIFADGFE
jgi:hypothetical protein